MFCPNCGSPVSDGSRFCSNCGAQLPAAAAPQPTPVQEAGAQPVWNPEPVSNQQPYQAQPTQQQDYQQAWQPQAAQQPDYQPQPFQQQTYQQQDYQQAWQQSAAVPVVAKKRSARKGILIGVGCLALAALIGGGIWFLSRGRSQNKLLRAAGNTLAELKAYTETLPNLNKIVENAEALSDSDALHTEQTLRSEMTFDYGDGTEFSYGYGIQYQIDCDQKAGILLLDGAVVDDETSVPFSFYVDKEQLQAASNAVLDDGEVVAIPLKDLAKQWNASALAEVTEITMPEDLDLSKYNDFSLETALEKTYGQDWITLRDSLDSVLYEGESPFEGSGTTYALTWDREALQRMYDKTDLDFDDLIELDLSEVQEKLDPNELISQIFIAVLGEFNKEISAPLFYVEDELLLGLHVKSADEEAPAELEIRLRGEQNPWEHLTVRLHNDYGTYTTDDMTEITMKQEKGQLRIEYSSRHEDSDGEEYRTEEGPYSVIYNDADGRITVEDEEGQVPEDMPEIFLLPEEGGFRFFYSKSENYDDTVFSTELTTVITNRVRAIAPLSATPTELLKLSEEELEELAERIEEKLGQFE